MKSLITYFLLCLAVIVFSFLYYPKYKEKGSEATISWDVSGYYWYLPSLFIYKDIKGLNFSDSLRKKYACTPDNQQITFLPDGNKVLKYSSGMALQYAPFFLIAHVLAEPLGYKADGLSAPYQLSIHLGALFMMIFGLWFLRKVLLEYFKDSTVVWVLILLVIGTNYLNYAAIDLGMSHSWLFAWYCFLLYQSNLFYKKPSFISALLIGLTLGILALTRPTEIIACMLPLLWGVNVLSVESIAARFRFIKTNFGLYVVSVMAMIMIGSVQLIYWKYVTGHFLVYSYGDQEFTWKHPHFLNYIFSYRCGWLIYCPLMVFPFVGFLFLFKKKEIVWTIGFFSFCYLWIVCAWDIWWYGGRAMIQGYAALMFPLAALIEYANKKMITKLIFFPLAFYCIYLNIWWVHGVHRGGIIYASDMSEAYYKKVKGKWHIDEQDRKLLDINEDFTGVKHNTDTLLVYNFVSKDTDVIMVEDKPVLFLQSDRAIEKKYPVDKKANSTNWVRVSASIECLKNNWDILRMTQFGIRFYKHQQLVKQNYLLLDRLFYNERKQRIYFDSQIEPKDYDSTEVFFNNGKEVQGAFYIDHLVVETFE